MVISTGTQKVQTSAEDFLALFWAVYGNSNMGHPPPLQKISTKSVLNFSTLSDRQTSGQTERQTDRGKNNLVASVITITELAERHGVQKCRYIA